ncbi:hypothetical protein Anas_03910 [Armadillidium nasatum]|uniref:Dynein heavy chain hydrolytic ATP-binding dynein motor region domain-containing protein n=1 Tax=Armadillidium nasatum TaxID=96803 RepID=A0A5N5SL29_9CRUS|nr:hypothetical protein Anas_03910 [Armadillidium nasatum]
MEKSNIFEHSGRLDVVVEISSEQTGYGFEYLGVPQSSFFNPCTKRVAFNLIAASLRSKCGTLVGGSGSGKLETLKNISRSFGQHLFSITCTSQTPAKVL